MKVIILDLEQTLLQTVRSRPNDKQKTVLLFARSLQSSPPPGPYIPLMAQDFRTDPVLTEFELLDQAPW
ncbi:MAG: hypothetical protein LH631_05645 [Alkalinema sp. CAN_BIN05]|nr:hypothetical protein [Alkalinema sp. CAN_BIN05]